MLKWLFGPGLREKVYLNHFMCVCVCEGYIPAGQLSNSVAAQGTEILLSTGGGKMHKTTLMAEEFSSHSVMLLFR